MALIPSYTVIDHALAVLDAVAEPAELHGMFCAFICIGRLLNGKTVLGHILELESQDDEMLRHARQQLLDLYEVTYHQLLHFDLSFSLLLPDDDDSLEMRTQALSHWCQGFMIALKMTGLKTRCEQLSEDCREALARFVDIATIDHEIIAVDDDDEYAFMHVSEFVRMAVLMICNELMDAQGGVSQHNSQVSSLH